MLFDKYFYLNNIKNRFKADHKAISIINNTIFTLHGFYNKPVLQKLYNRWLNLYNTFFGQGDVI